MLYTWELFRFKLNNLDGDKWEEYIAADSSLSAFGHVWESLNSEKEFIEQMEYIDEVNFKIEDKSESKAEWREFVEHLDVRSQITNALLRNAFTIFDSYEIKSGNAPRWFRREIERPNGGRIQDIRNIGKKSILDIRDALMKDYE